MLFAYQIFGASGVFCDLGSSALSLNVTTHYCSGAVQWNNFKIFFGLSSSFQYRQKFCKESNYSSRSFLSFKYIDSGMKLDNSTGVFL